MRARLLRLAAGFLVSAIVASAVVASAPAIADVTWSGIGFYVVRYPPRNYTDPTVISGPYATEAVCKPYLPPDTGDSIYSCLYENSDPMAPW